MTSALRKWGAGMHPAPGNNDNRKHSIAPMTRRDFLQRSMASGFALSGLTWTSAGALALEPLHRPGKSRLRLSLAAYSFRDFFNHLDPERRLSLIEFIDYCADHNCDGTELTSYYFPKELTDEFLTSLKRHAHLRGVDISGTAVGNNFARPDGPELRAEIEAVKGWIDRAALLGAPHIRVFAGNPQGIDKETAKRQCTRALEECGDYAAGKGVWLGLENHGGIVAQVADLLDIVKGVQSPWVGINLDTGNFYSDRSPYDEMADLAPYAVNVQLKVALNLRGTGRQPTDLQRVVRLLRNANYQGYVALEYEEKDPWAEIPGWLARMQEAFRAE